MHHRLHHLINVWCFCSTELSWDAFDRPIVYYATFWNTRSYCRTLFLRLAELVYQITLIHIISTFSCIHSLRLRSQTSTKTLSHGAEYLSPLRPWSREQQICRSIFNFRNKQIHKNSIGYSSHLLSRALPDVFIHCLPYQPYTPPFFLRLLSIESYPSRDHPSAWSLWTNTSISVVPDNNSSDSIRIAHSDCRIVFVLDQARNNCNQNIWLDIQHVFDKKEYHMFGSHHCKKDSSTSFCFGANTDSEAWYHWVPLAIIHFVFLVRCHVHSIPRQIRNCADVPVKYRCEDSCAHDPK